MYCTQRHDATVRIVRFKSYQRTHIDAHTSFSLKNTGECGRKREKKKTFRTIGLVLV